ncbi:tetratricopeptide repeat protein [candidate division KSB1 bacterium]|nr:tetratricopeptide repeat protein [candidate division KSB1 bacterium]NIR69534.1 tetratricopeptide repeat protein [candidate division KSB1 bacterium]NIS24302.1 tetratricopeptide repeat protein [candidate division KSB1 bacterium]NIT71217.1 tetratricopeptide repeat protein [candidate division KSB1 bacterium]NIU24921.1 tetratricopeptide repeat protein [candidate division KSB1 bacterium]
MFPNYHISPEAMKYFKKAYQLQMEGQFQRAVILYKKSLEIEPTAEAHTFLGWTYSFMGKLKEAIEECHKAISVDPDFGNPYNDIGAYYLQLGEFDEAIPWFERAKRAKRYETPEFAYCNLGKVYELKGLWPLAMEEYIKALQLRPEYAPARIALMKLQAKLN